MNCFITTDDAQTIRSFVRAARRCHVTRLQNSKVSDTLWSQYIFGLGQEYLKSSSSQVKTLVSCVGKQPGHNVWVFDQITQIDSKGQTIPLEDQQFYWHKEYHLCCEVRSSSLLPIAINKPLSLCGLKGIVMAAKECLGQNFVPTFLTVAGSVLAFHYESVVKMDDSCPITLCYSQSSGTGKTSALRLALSLFGVTDYLGGKSSMASIVNRAATSTLPIGLDDIKSPAVFEDIAVQFFNGSLHSTISSGSIRARASVLVTANQAFCDTERNAQRLLHIPFSTPSSGNVSRANEMRLSEARQNASSSIGVMVAINRLIDSPLFRDVLDQRVLPYVEAKLPGLHFRLHKSYSLLLMITNVLCRLLPDCISWQAVKSFFDSNMSEEVKRIHSSQACVIDTFLEKLYSCLADAQPSEVLQTLRSLIAGRGAEDSVGIYLPTARGYFDVDEKALKQAVKEVGGGWNTSSLFLPATSVATCVTSETGKTRKSVVKIPRSKVAPNLLKRLDSLCTGSAAVISDSRAPVSVATPTVLADPFSTDDMDTLFLNWTREVNLDCIDLGFRDDESSSDDGDIGFDGDSSGDDSDSVDSSDDNGGPAAPSSSSSDDDDELYFNFVQHFRKALRRDAFTLKDGEKEIDQSSVEDNGEECDSGDSMHQLCAGVDKLISLHSTATSALIHPKEVSTPTCDAACCKIQHFKGKESIDWVQCDGCDKWLHSYCIGLSIKEIEKMLNFYCDECSGQQ